MSHRQDRVSHEIQREVSRLLEQEARDPRLENVTITNAHISGDLRHATIYYVTRQPEGQAEIQQALEHASGFLRRAVARRLDLRFAPDLQFRLDQSIEKGERFLALLDQIHQEEEK